jgi:hypothetical protein
MTTTAPETATRRPTGALLLLAALTVPAAFGAGLVAVVIIGPLALLVPFAYAGAVYACVAYGRRGVVGDRVREAVAAVIGGVAGFGTWAFMMLVGIFTEVLPFLDSRSENYPHMDEWEAGSVLVGVVAAVAMWWLLRTLSRSAERAR